MPGLRSVQSLGGAAAQAGSQAAPGEAHPTGQARACRRTSCTWNEKVVLIPKGDLSHWATITTLSRSRRNVERRNWAWRDKPGDKEKNIAKRNNRGCYPRVVLLLSAWSDCEFHEAGLTDNIIKREIFPQYQFGDGPKTPCALPALCFSLLCQAFSSFVLTDVTLQTYLALLGLWKF